jgi:hypothetical protein
MANFVTLHLFNDFSRPPIACRQALKVILEVSLDLSFGFCHKAEVTGNPCTRRQHAKGKRTHIPNRIQ